MSRHANIAIFVPHNGCPHTCSFCNQRTISGAQTQPAPADVTAALEAFAARSDRPSAELAFFGGSFTAIDRDYMCSLLEAVQPYIAAGVVTGIRCSTRPDCIDADILDVLERYHVTAIELGAQSMDDRVLRLNERGHTADDVRRASIMISARGIELGLQMMTGLYGDTEEGAMLTARELAALRPATVRIYPTVVLRGTRLAELYEQGEYRPQGLEGAVELGSRLLEYFAAEGIAVIRLGLHASPDVEASLVGGAYHPALRELCEGRCFLRRMTALLEVTGRKKAVIAVNPRDVSKATGQRSCNIAALREAGTDIKITGAPDVPPGEVRLV